METSQLISKASQLTDFYIRGTPALNGLSIDSRVCKSNEGLTSAFKVFTLHAGHYDSSSFFQLKIHAARQFKQNLCSHFNTFIGFPHFCVINIIQFHFRWNIIRFSLRS